ncbi:hypothetical protein ACJX0J_027709, partial [Zea mays]
LIKCYKKISIVIGATSLFLVPKQHDMSIFPIGKSMNPNGRTLCYLNKKVNNQLILLLIKKSMVILIFKSEKIKISTNKKCQ